MKALVEHAARTVTRAFRPVDHPPGWRQHPHVREPRHVVVVGGGLAGLAAATILAERSVKVTVLEREPFLGGRAGAWPDQLRDGTPFQMERGFHAFFRQYYNLRALMRRVDPTLSSLVPLDDYPIVEPSGRTQSFANLPRFTPLNIVALVARAPSLRARDLLRVDALSALQMLRFDPEETYRRFDHLSARAFLDGLRLPPDARRMLFEVFAHSFFNPEEGMSAAEMLMMFHFYFTGNPEGLLFDVLSAPFSRALIQPLQRRLESMGATVRLQTAAREIVRRDGRTRYTVALENGEAIEADAVVLAVPVDALEALLARSPTLEDRRLRTSIDSLEATLPFAVLRLWLDRPVRRPHPFVGTAGFDRLDNVSLYHLIEDESREWAARTGGAVVELHAYAVPENADEADVRHSLLEGLHAVYPETRGAQIVEARFLMRRDCPAFAPGSHRARPGVETSLPGLVLAGDFVRLPHPSALMERATMSGFMAANTLLAGWDVRGETVRSVPSRGLLTL